MALDGDSTTSGQKDRRAARYQALGPPDSPVQFQARVNTSSNASVMVSPSERGVLIRKGSDFAVHHIPALNSQRRLFLVQGERLLFVGSVARAFMLGQLQGTGFDFGAPFRW